MLSHEANSVSKLYPDQPRDMRYRRLQSPDTQKIIRHFRRLDPEDLRMRFFGYVHQDVVRKICVERAWNESIVIGAFVSGRLRAIGEMTRCAGPLGLEVEIALSVEARYQNAGIGSELLRRILVSARNRYIQRVHMLCLADNTKMQKVAKKFEAILLFERDHVEGRIWPPVPSYFSLMEEAIDEPFIFFKAVFDPLC